MDTNPVIFLNILQVLSGRLGQHPIPEPYRLLCEFLHCGVIDRTRTLDQGFEYCVLDPIPRRLLSAQSFSQVCDETARAIVDSAQRTGQRIHVLWSGGIDSTTALIALFKAASANGCDEIISVLLSENSIIEYPHFFSAFVAGHYDVVPILRPIPDYLNPDVLTVTGEHGDQLFGSFLLQPYVESGLAECDYLDVLPGLLRRRFGTSKKADMILRYIEQQIAAAPITILTLFDCMWWLNFSMKWQQVSLRLPVFCRDGVFEKYRSLWHFFRGEEFQLWSLTSPSARYTPAWELYKLTAKSYILEYTKDPYYYLLKEKERSLMHVMVAPSATAYRGDKVFMRADFRPVFEGGQEDII